MHEKHGQKYKINRIMLEMKVLKKIIGKTKIGRIRSQSCGIQPINKRVERRRRRRRDWD